MFIFAAIASAESWQSASLTSLIIAVLIYPVLSLLEHESWYGQLFVQKSEGEIKKSLLKVFFMFAVLTAAAWGIFGRPHAAAAAVLMWGVGDAFAALVGIPLGKHKVKWKLTDGKKSWEGSLAMFAVSLAAGIVFLRLYCGYDTKRSLICALLMALTGTVTELMSPSEWDTLTVPVIMLASALIIL